VLYVLRIRLNGYTVVTGHLELSNNILSRPGAGIAQSVLMVLFRGVPRWVRHIVLYWMVKMSAKL
jgi:hypothetical protein